jgi:DNA-binding transcriptional LysR family regulator
MTPPAWDDLRLLAAVARHGALAPAARETGLSTATLSRRLRALEAQQGARLFAGGAGGYGLTPEGRRLAAVARRMEEAAGALARPAGPPRVRLSAGTWTAQALAAGLTEYWSPEAGWIPEFVHCDRDLDIARGEVDIGIRNRRPDGARLAGRRFGSVEFAPYAARPDVEGWIAPTHDAAVTPSGRWILARHGASTVTRVNSPHLARAMAEAGAGRIVLPLFAGDAAPGLVRAGPVIDELRAEQWLVTHQKRRHDPPVRAAIRALAGPLARLGGRRGGG